MPGILAFEDFELDEPRFELRRRGVRVEVQPKVLHLLRRALSALDGGDPQKPVLQALLAKALSYGPARERVPDALEALAAARRLCDPAARGEALQGCLYALLEPEWLPQRIEIARELEVAGHERGDHRLLRFAASARIWTAVERGDMRAADAAIDTLEAIARQVRDPHARWQTELFRTMRALVDGRLDVAAQRAADAHALGAKLSPASAEHVFALQKNAVFLLDGRSRKRRCWCATSRFAIPRGRAGRSSSLRTKRGSVVPSGGGWC